MARLKKESSIEERTILQEQITESSDNLYRMINKKAHSFFHDQTYSHSITVN